MGAPEVKAFLTHLAVVGRVAASTQSQAKSALLFFCTRRCWRRSSHGWTTSRAQRPPSVCPSC
jgi:hypothetical protein